MKLIAIILLFAMLMNDFSIDSSIQGGCCPKLKRAGNASHSNIRQWTSEHVSSTESRPTLSPSHGSYADVESNIRGSASQRETSPLSGSPLHSLRSESQRFPSTVSGSPLHEITTQSGSSATHEYPRHQSWLPYRESSEQQTPFTQSSSPTPRQRVVQPHDIAEPHNLGRDWGEFIFPYFNDGENYPHFPSGGRRSHQSDFSNRNASQGRGVPRLSSSDDPSNINTRAYHSEPASYRYTSPDGPSEQRTSGGESTSGIIDPRFQRASSSSSSISHIPVVRTASGRLVMPMFRGATVRLPSTTDSSGGADA